MERASIITTKADYGIIYFTCGEGVQLILFQLIAKSINIRLGTFSYLDDFLDPIDCHQHVMIFLL